MKTSQFRTNAKCDGCVARIADKLNEIVPREQWSIDLSTADKVLTVTADVPDEKIIAEVKSAGYKAEKLESPLCCLGCSVMLCNWIPLFRFLFSA